MYFLNILILFLQFKKRRRVNCLKRQVKYLSVRVTEMCSVYDSVWHPFKAIVQLWRLDFFNFNFIIARSRQVFVHSSNWIWQDQHLIEPTIEGLEGHSLFAVFDGHGGQNAANFAATMLLSCLQKSASFSVYVSHKVNLQ